MTDHQPDLPLDGDIDTEHASDEAAELDNADQADQAADDEQANPIPAVRADAAPAAQEPPAQQQAAGADVAPKVKKRGRPAKKDEQQAAPATGADVTPKASKRQAQVEQLKGLLELRASVIASLACQVIGWAPLDEGEAAAIDAEFEGWKPPPEFRKAIVVGLVVLPRAAADNRLRSAIGLGPVDGGDAAAAAAAELQRQRQELERQQQQAAAARPEAAPAEQPRPRATIAAPAAGARMPL